MRKVSVLVLLLFFAGASLSFADASGWSHNQTNKDLGSISFTGGKYGGMKGGKIELRFQDDRLYLGLFDLKYNSGTEAEMNSLNHEQDLIEKYGLMLTEESEIMPVSLYTCKNGNTVAITRFSLGDKLPSIYMLVFTEGKDD